MSLDEAKRLYQQANRDFRERMLSVGRLLQGHIERQVGNGRPRGEVTVEVRAALGCSKVQLGELLVSWAVFRLYDAKTCPYSHLSLFRVFIRRAGAAYEFDDAMSDSRELFRRMEAEGWSYRETKWQIRAALGVRPASTVVGRQGATLLAVVVTPVAVQRALANATAADAAAMLMDVLSGLPRRREIALRLRVLLAPLLETAKAKA